MIDSILDFLKNALEIAGGTTVVALLFGKFAVNKTVDILEKRYDEKMSEQLESHKAQLGKKEYISKTRFDTEFKIYQELSEKHISAVYDAGEAVLMARGMYDFDINLSNDFTNRFCVSLDDAEISLKKYAPFISQEIYEKYKELDKKITDICRLSLAISNTRSSGEADINFRYGGINYNLSTAAQEIEKIQKDITVRSDDIIMVVRKYLNGLDVIE